MGHLTHLGIAALLLTACAPSRSGEAPPPDLAAAVDASVADEQPPVPPPDLTVLPPGPDLRPCPSYPPGGGGARDRPEVLVPAGAYQIEAVKFSVEAFYLDVFEVTVGAFRQCRALGGCKSDPLSASGCRWEAAPGTYEEHPVDCVTWAQADEFCRWVGRRLPTEGEREYAAAGPGRSTYPWGNEAPDRQLCWRMNAITGSCPVGGYPLTLLGAPNCGGAADLAGNAWEWTGTEISTPYVHPGRPCHLASRACAVRGGYWQNTFPDYVQVTYRYGTNPPAAASGMGFRCARTIDRPLD